mgnify:CR=1 FL=1
MSTKTPHRKKSSHRRGDIRDNYIPLGTDADGRAHVYRTLDESIHVIADGQRVHREDVTRRTVDEWMAYVEGRVGWADRRYGRGIGGMVEAIADAVEGDR